MTFIDYHSTLIVDHLAEEIVLGGMSKYRKLAPSHITASANCEDFAVPTVPTGACGRNFPAEFSADKRSAKNVLDTMGPEYLCRTWIQQQSKFARRAIYLCLTMLT